MQAKQLFIPSFCRFPHHPIFQKIPRQGFTLIELVIVIILLSTLAIMILPKFGDIDERSRINSAQKEMREIQKAIMGDDDFRGYLQDVGSLPTNLSNLLDAQSGSYNPFLQTGGTRGDYLSDSDLDNDGAGDGTPDVLQDPWDNDYSWNNGTGLLYSFGPNETDDSATGDDITLDVDG